MRSLLVLFLFVTCAFSQVPTSGMISWHKFNGNALDSGTRNLNFTVSGSPTYVPDRFGNPNKALYFDGVDDVLSSDHIMFNDNRTISMWQKVNSTDFVTISKGIVSNQVISNYIFKGPSAAKYNPHDQMLDITGRGNNSYQVPLDTSNKWQHIVICFIYGQSQVKVYLNGVLYGTSALTFGVSNERPLLIGKIEAMDPLHTYFSKGTIDDLIYYSRAISPEEVMQLYRDGQTTKVIPSTHTIKTPVVKHSNKTINIQGRRINKPSSGVYITEGKCVAYLQRR